ncbi:MAG TPA: hypothetical protein VJT83_03345, partial [Chitinophagaceae bacterium]|nr:hypothetical protein [Chitinophagaceae bacterium]
MRKVLRLFAKVVIAILLFIVVVFILIQTPPVQNFARKKVQSYLSNKLDTKVTIGKLYIGLPDIISLQNVYIEDRSKDTLLAGGKLKVDIDLFKLFSNVVEINEIQLEDITAKIKRNFPDTVYNFQFIVDAFTPANRKPVNTADSSVMQMDISSILLNNVHLIYKDVVTGNDMDINIKHLTTKIDKFDPYKYIFDVPSMQVNGVKARIYQSKPLVTSADPVSKDMADATKPVDFDLKFKAISLENIDLDYRNDVSAFYNKINIGNLDVNADKIDLPNKIINLSTVKMENTNTAVRLGNKPAAKEVAQAVKQNVQSNVEVGGWKVFVNTLEVNNNTIQYDDDSKPHVAGMDYSHLLAKKLTLHVDDLVYNLDSISGKITKGTMQEKSGFVLNKLQGEVLYSARETHLRDLLIETPGSVIRRDIVLTYPSIEAISKNPSSLRMNIDLDDTKVQVKDLLAFAPQLRSQPIFKDRNDTWYLNGRVNGTLSNLRIETLQASGLRDTRLDISGTLVGLPNPDNARGNLRINKLVTSRRDVELFVPPSSFPKNITIPESLSMSGTISGNVSDFSPNLAVNTTLGSARIRGRIRNATNPDALVYGVTVSTNNLDVGTIIQDQENFGRISGTITANGYGIDPQKANAKFNGIINSAVINKYNYHNVKFDGTIAQRNLDAHVAIADPNIRLSLDATGTFVGDFPSLKFDATIDSIKAMPLNFSTTDIAYRG